MSKYFNVVKILFNDRVVITNVKTDLLVCSAAALFLHCWFLVSYRWTAESDYRGCHPSDLPAERSKNTNRERERENTAVTLV